MGCYIDAFYIPVTQNEVHPVISAEHNKINIVAIFGLALGAVFGMAGTMVTQSNLRNLSWGIDSAGLVMATYFTSSEVLQTGK